MWLRLTMTTGLLAMVVVAQRGDAMCEPGPEEAAFELVDVTIVSCGPPRDDELKAALVSIRADEDARGMPEERRVPDDAYLDLLRRNVPSATPWTAPETEQVRAVSYGATCDEHPKGRRTMFRMSHECCDMGAIGGLGCALEWPYLDEVPGWVVAAGFAERPDPAGRHD